MAMRIPVPYEPRTFGELEALAKRICESAMIPPAYRGKPNDVAIAIMYGREIGLHPITALQHIAVINGRPSVFGDALSGLAKKKGLISDMQERIEGDGDTMVAICEVTRPNGTVVRQTFSVADAKQAALWGKQGPWSQYPRRMLQMRARSWAIRDAAPDGLFGMSAEEAHDHEISQHARNITPLVPERSVRDIITILENGRQSAQEPHQAPTAAEDTEVPAEPSLALDEPQMGTDNRIPVTWPGEQRCVYLSSTNAAAVFRRKAETKSPTWQVECLKINPQLAALMLGAEPVVLAAYAKRFQTPGEGTTSAADD